MSGKTARTSRAAARAVPPPPRKPTTQGALSGIPRGWLYGGLAVAAVAIVIALVLASQLGGSKSTSSTTVDGSKTATMLAGVPQQGASLGSPDAPVVMYEFADLQCPFCQKWDQNVLPVLIKDYVREGKLRIVFRGLTFIGPDSEKALRAALAAGEQNRLWYAVDLFYHQQGPENSGWVSGELVNGIGAAVPGLDTGTMVADEGSGSVTKEIVSAADQAASLGIRSTPFFLIGTSESNLAPLPFDRLEPEQFRQAIDAALGR